MTEDTCYEEIVKDGLIKEAEHPINREQVSLKFSDPIIKEIFEAGEYLADVIASHLEAHNWLDANSAFIRWWKATRFPKCEK